jgi:transposase
MNPSRRQFTAQEKVAILRQHLVEHVPISELCERHGLQPSLFYLWQRTFFENGAAAFAGNGRHAKKAESLQQQKVERLEAKLQRKDEVLAELMEEHVQLKKSLGEP